MNRLKATVVVFGMAIVAAASGCGGSNTDSKTASTSSAPVGDTTQATGQAADGSGAKK